MNAHVSTYYLSLSFLCHNKGLFFAEAHYYALAMLELDPNWKAEYVTK